MFLDSIAILCFVVACLLASFLPFFDSRPFTDLHELYQSSIAFGLRRIPVIF